MHLLGDIVIHTCPHARAKNLSLLTTICISMLCWGSAAYAKAGEQALPQGSVAFREHYVPSESGYCSVSRQGNLLILKLPTGRIESAETAPDGKPSLLVQRNSGDFDIVGFEDIVSRLDAEHIKIGFDSEEHPVVAWNAGNEILARRLSVTESLPSIVLTDHEAHDIQAFTLMQSSRSYIEYAWVDCRKSHYKYGCLPQVYAGRYTKDGGRSVARVSQRTGKYLVFGIKGASDRAGNSYLVWDQVAADPDASGQLFLSVRRATEWSKPVQITHDPPLRDHDPILRAPIPSYHLEFDVVVEGSNKAWIIWHREEPKDEVIAREVTSGLLGAEQVVARNVMYPLVAGASTGNLHLIYQDRDPYLDSNRYETQRTAHQRKLYYIRSESGTWTEPKLLSSSSFEATATIGVDGEGRAHVCWLEFVNGTARLMHASDP